MHQEYFDKFRKHIIGIAQDFESPFGTQRICYADWTASGRLYRPIEDILSSHIAPFVGNTHTETSVTGSSMTLAYHHAKDIIKKHVNATDNDILISSNSGMTGVVNKLQRILGLKVHESFRSELSMHEDEKPLVLVSHMEHHSNQTSWIETIADVKVIGATPEGLVDMNHLKELLETYENRKRIYCAVTSCSNVTGIMTPYHEIAKLVHQYEGYCFVDFACSAPYIDINMHPADPKEKLDAIYFSPHKFLGGPSSSGILIFCQSQYNNKIPDNPGGGTVDWTNPWGEHRYFEEIEAREDGGTPSFIQTMRVALCVKLKEEMKTSMILEREHFMVERIFGRLMPIANLHLLAENITDRLGVISFYIDDLHYNLGVKLLNDRYGIQVRGGCSCAGTYGHYLLEVSYEKSKAITNLIDEGDRTLKPGWIRMSIHPTMTDEELEYILTAIESLSAHHKSWSEDYTYCSRKNEFSYNGKDDCNENLVQEWFSKALV